MVVATAVIKNHHGTSVCDIRPNNETLWLGLGGNYDNLKQIFSELLDNILGNFIIDKVRNPNIVLEIEPSYSVPEKYPKFKVTLHDYGTGMDLTKTLVIGFNDSPKSFINYYGYGYKAALAGANPDNNAWSVYTRSEADWKNNSFYYTEAPYTNEQPIHYTSETNEPWVGYFPHGTVTSFEISESLLFTACNKANKKTEPIDCLISLKNYFGYVYSGAISSSQMTITIESKALNFSERVKAITPNWGQTLYKDVKTIYLDDIEEEHVEVHYHIGEMLDHNDGHEFYHPSQRCSGVEVRINGRVFESGLITNIWDKEKHPSQNNFLAILDITSNDEKLLPIGKTAKNGIRVADNTIEKVYEWLRLLINEPPKKLNNQCSEKDWLNQLEIQKKKHNSHPAASIEREFKVYKSSGTPVAVDLKVFDGSKLYLFEGKKAKATIKAIHQLRMYWDGCVEDGLTPYQGILVSDSFPNELLNIIDSINNMYDAKGNKYNLAVTTWKVQGITAGQELI
ncbi:hypothetical protein JOC85_001174 [Bacillus mesophilus]|uniref:Uncharacterized protein n=1 Tax=Bacillus mesophilus TaxID=1808955 RepID=A0A6M0Q4G7_9BACI|nr:hypothetical protein [Bacillus mesophilus]MBM7660407.1 hypothetical protein [Bacillus mesophilus]NEY71114.1 hypothetical protein [Bacillus mesophilus]